MKSAQHFFKFTILGFLALLAILAWPLIVKNNVAWADTNGSLNITSAPSVVKPSESFPVTAELCNTTGSTQLINIEATVDRDGSAFPSNGSYSLAAGECRNISFTITSPSPTSNSCPTGNNIFNIYFDNFTGFGSDQRTLQLYSQIGLTITNNSPDWIDAVITGTNFGGAVGQTFSVAPNGQAGGPNDLWNDVNCIATPNVSVTISVTRQRDGAPMGSFTSALTKVQNGCHFQVRIDYNGPAATPTPIPTAGPTATPTPTPVPNRVDLITSFSCTAPGGTPTLNAGWTGSSQNGCDIYIRAGFADNQISSACNGSWSDSVLARSGPVVAGGTYQLFASDGTKTLDGGQVTCPSVPSPTPTFTPTPTPTPSCIAWDSVNCTKPGGSTCSDWGTTGYCNWNSCAWDTCNIRCTGNTLNLCPIGPTPTPTPIPSCIAWDSVNCTKPGGSTCSDWGTTGYCSWNSCAWDTCNKKCTGNTMNICPATPTPTPLPPGIPTPTPTPPGGGTGCTVSPETSGQNINWLVTTNVASGQPSSNQVLINGSPQTIQSWTCASGQCSGRTSQTNCPTSVTLNAQYSGDGNSCSRSHICGAPPPADCRDQREGNFGLIVNTSSEPKFEPTQWPHRCWWKYDGTKICQQTIPSSLVPLEKREDTVLLSEANSKIKDQRSKIQVKNQNFENQVAEGPMSRVPDWFVKPVFAQQSCTTDANCNDGNACTLDRCEEVCLEFGGSDGDSCLRSSKQCTHSNIPYGTACGTSPNGGNMYCGGTRNTNGSLIPNGICSDNLCRIDTDCNDSNVCTTDSCPFDPEFDTAPVVCRNTAVYGTVCGTSPNGGNMYCGGTRVTPSGACSDSACKTNAECNDGNLCTQDSCAGYRPADPEIGPEVLGSCKYPNQPPSYICQRDASGNPTKLCSVASSPTSPPAAQCTVDFVACSDVRADSQFCCGLVNKQLLTTCGLNDDGQYVCGASGNCSSAPFFVSWNKDSDHPFNTPLDQPVTPLAGVVIHVDNTKCGISRTGITDARGEVIFDIPVGIGRISKGNFERLDYTVWAEVPTGSPFTRGVYFASSPLGLLTNDPAKKILLPTDGPQFVNVQSSKTSFAGDVFNVNQWISFGFKGISLSPTPTPTPIPPKISGEVFVDDNRNGKKDGKETNYTGSITVNAIRTDAPGSGSYSCDATKQSCTGVYSISLPAGTHQVSLTPPPNYIFTTPSYLTRSVPPNVSDADFGISLGNPWFQTQEGDVRSGGSINVNMLAGQQFSKNGPAGSPGVVFYGSSGTASFGSGQISSKNWLVQENYASTLPSYDSLLNQASSGVISDLPCGNSCNNEPATSGVYKVGGDGNLTVQSTWRIVNGKSVVVFVPGNLDIQGGSNKQNIQVDGGGFLAFVVKGNITVNSSIGNNSANDLTSNLDGWYITDGSFDTGGGGRRLNMAGLVFFKGSLINSRDLGSDNATYPSLVLSYRIDLALNANPALGRSTLRWEEIAP